MSHTDDPSVAVPYAAPMRVYTDVATITIAAHSDYPAMTRSS
jgi:hypothetical protein